ncbi:MAG: hypothetical protein ACREED_03065 [Stellaceae bacterium]
MNTPEMIYPPRTSLSQDFAALLRYWGHVAWARIGRRRALILLGVAIAAAGLALNWTGLTAIGVAPVLLAIAPCAAMCALGLCMGNMKGGQSCSTNPGGGADASQVAGPRSDSAAAAEKTESDPG